MNRLSRKPRGFQPIKAIRRAVTLPTITPRKGEAWIV